MKSETEIRAELKLLKAVVQDVKGRGGRPYAQSGAAHALEWVLGIAVEKNMAPSELHANIEWIVGKAAKRGELDEPT